jgi:hypothetical protein
MKICNLVKWSLQPRTGGKTTEQTTVTPPQWSERDQSFHRPPPDRPVPGEDEEVWSS